MSEPLVPVPRRARPWQPNPALLLVSAARAFAAEHWDDVREDARARRDDASANEPTRSFTDDGLAVARDGFQPMQIRPFTQPLSELSRQALQRFNAEQAAANPIVDAPELQNALLQDANAAAVRAFRSGPHAQHAAFVPDVYEYDDELDEQLDEQIDAQADTEGEAEANLDGHEEPWSAESEGVTDELQEDVALEAAQSEEAAEEPFGEEADVEAHETESAQQAAANVEPSEAHDVPVAEHADAEPTDAEPAEAPLNETEAHTLEASDAAAAATEAETAEVEATEDTPQASETEAVESEVMEPELAEADLAQDDVVGPEALAEAESEAVEAAVDAAMEQSQPEAVIQGVDPEEVARREAEKYQQGYAEGERMAREAMAQEIAAQRTVLEGVTRELHALLQDQQKFFEPLKRLAVHVAEQVVRHELKTSSHAIESLIQRCLDTLDHPAQGMVVVELHPQDKARLIEAAPELIKGMRIDAVESLQPGSVRLFANDTIVEDLVAHRLHTFVKALNLNESAWQAQSALLHAEPAESDVSAHNDTVIESTDDHALPSENQSESDDVHP